MRNPRSAKWLSTCAMLRSRLVGSNSSIFESKSIVAAESWESIPQDLSTPQQPIALTVLSS
ncbi:hypothetical protein PsorP6_000456 [Peronosclerospora sorghi]|uniref:Uncharacterized protein n=1 Tax=Peronosclerospora sorghi TaxID=230839 RepID=A0ACC0WTH1_9STRA|nr:hypothetical protein PsorP6_000456 [Peronosclerospora sorghi]